MKHILDCTAFPFTSKFLSSMHFNANMDDELTGLSYQTEHLNQSLLFSAGNNRCRPLWGSNNQLCSIFSTFPNDNVSELADIFLPNQSSCAVPRTTVALSVSAVSESQNKRLCFVFITGVEGQIYGLRLCINSVIWHLSERVWEINKCRVTMNYEWVESALTACDSDLVHGILFF